MNILHHLAAKECIMHLKIGSIVTDMTRDFAYASTTFHFDRADFKVEPTYMYLIYQNEGTFVWQYHSLTETVWWEHGSNKIQDLFMILTQAQFDLRLKIVQMITSCEIHEFISSPFLLWWLDIVRRIG